jgi:hypothetical protein
MGNRKWEMGNGKWEMGNGKWEMGNGKWEMSVLLRILELSRSYAHFIDVTAQ